MNHESCLQKVNDALFMEGKGLRILVKQILFFSFFDLAFCQITSFGPTSM